MTLAAAYVRVSTKDQADEGLSLDAQLRAIRKHAEAQGWALVEYVEAGISASKEGADRPQFRQVLADVEAGRIDVVIVHKLDRFSRQMVVTMQSLRRISRANAGFVSLSELIDMSTPSGRLMLGIHASLAEFYSDNLASEVSKGRAERAAQGLWNGDLPFGYKRGATAQDIPTVIPSEGALVLRCYELYAAGTSSAEQIAIWLNGQGVVPRSKGPVQRRFTKATVVDMLTNPFYTGQIRYKDKVLPGAHEGVVSEELYDLVQSTKMSRRKLTTAVKSVSKATHLLRGIGHCVSCSQLLWVTADGKTRYPRYRDASSAKQLPCRQSVQSVSAAEIDEQMAGLMSRLVIPADWQAIIARMMEEEQSPKEAHATRQVLKARLERLRDVYLDGEMSKARYDAERVRLRAELNHLDAAQITRHVGVGVIERIGELWVEATAEERCDMVREVFEEVYVDMDERRISYVKPRPALSRICDVLRAGKPVIGDPDRVRGNSLHASVMVMRRAGALYLPAELVA